MVLALAAMVGLYGIVQAQSSGDRIISVEGTNLEGNEYANYFAASAITEATFAGTDTASTATNADGGLVIVEDVSIPNNVGTDDDATPKDESSDGLNPTANEQADPPTTAEEISGRELAGADARYFFINQSNGEVRVRDAASLAYIQNLSNRGVFNFEVRIYVDTDTAVDSGNGAPINGAADLEPPGEEATPRQDDISDDRDEVNVLSVTIHTLKLDTDRFIYGATVTDVADTPLMGLGADGSGYSKGIGVTGLPSGAAVTVEYHHGSIVKLGVMSTTTRSHG